MTDTLSERELKDHETGYLSLLAGRMDAQSRLLAKKQHELGYIYVLYGALDGLSLSYSMIKYVFDLILSKSKLSSSDLLHEWLMSSDGIVVAATTSIAAIAFSMMANYFKDDDANVIKRSIAILYPYLRGLTKGLKNGFKGFRSMLQVVETLGGLELKYLILPLGLFLGCVSVMHRLWYIKMVENRKDMMKANTNLLNMIQTTEDMSLEDLDSIMSGVRNQSMALRVGALGSAAFGGMIDGLYLYMGVLSLTSFFPPALIAMTVFCAVYFVSCVATRMYEEYDFQKRLDISRAKIELAYEGKKIELYFLELREFSKQLAKDPENEELLNERDKTFALFEKAVINFQYQQNKLLHLSLLSNGTAFLAGLKNGLAAYGAVVSFVIALGLIVPVLPQALLITVISFGIVLLAGFAAHSLYYNSQYRVKQEQVQVENITKPQKLGLAELENIFHSAKQQVKDLKPEILRAAILNNMIVCEPAQQYYFQEWFEIFRSFWSALMKGGKAVALILNPFMVMGSDGHYHESIFMLCFGAASALIHALTFSLRAHARSFGRPPIDTKPLIDDKEIELTTIKSSEDIDDVEEELIELNILPESCKILSLPSSYNPRYSLFSRPQKEMQQREGEADDLLEEKPRSERNSLISSYWGMMFAPKNDSGQEKEKEKELEEDTLRPMSRAVRPSYLGTLFGAKTESKSEEKAIPEEDTPRPMPRAVRPTLYYSTPEDNSAREKNLSTYSSHTAEGSMSGHYTF